MQVETYECQETAAEPVEASEEAVRLMEEMGLLGQKELICPSSNIRENARCPYPAATKEQLWVFKTLCPSATRIEQYKRSPIPLRVLQVAAHAESLKFFNRIEVWDKDEAIVDDPVMVGIVAPNQYSVTSTHLLARWGDVLESWPTLLKAAAETWRHTTLATLSTIASRVEVYRNTIASATADAIIHGERKSPTYYD